MQIFEVNLFFKLCTKIQQKTDKPTYLLSIWCQEAGGKKRARDSPDAFFLLYLAHNLCTMFLVTSDLAGAKTVSNFKSPSWLIILYTWIKSHLNLLYFEVSKSSSVNLSVYSKSFKLLISLAVLLCTLSNACLTFERLTVFWNRETTLYYNTPDEAELGLFGGFWKLLYLKKINVLLIIPIILPALFM